MNNKKDEEMWMYTWFSHLHHSAPLLLFLIKMNHSWNCLVMKVWRSTKSRSKFIWFFHILVRVEGNRFTFVILTLAFPFIPVFYEQKHWNKPKCSFWGSIDPCTNTFKCTEMYKFIPYSDLLLLEYITVEGKKGRGNGEKIMFFYSQENICIDNMKRKWWEILEGNDGKS